MGYEVIDLFRIRFRHLYGFLFTIGLFPIVSNLWFGPLASFVVPILHSKSPAEIAERLWDTASCLARPTCANLEQFEITIKLYSAEEVV
jgi:hypothetical protein